LQSQHSLSTEENQQTRKVKPKEEAPWALSSAIELNSSKHKHHLPERLLSHNISTGEHMKA